MAKLGFYTYLAYALVIVIGAIYALTSKDLSDTLNVSRYTLFLGLLFSSVIMIVWAYIWRRVHIEKF